MIDWPAEWNDIAEVRLHVLKLNTEAVDLFTQWGFKVAQTTFHYYVGHWVLRMVRKIE